MCKDGGNGLKEGSLAANSIKLRLILLIAHGKIQSMIENIDEERCVKNADSLNALMQKWIDDGATLTEMLYVLGSSFVALLSQCGAPRNKVEKLRRDIQKWIDSTDAKESNPTLNRAQRRAMKKTKH